MKIDRWNVKNNSLCGYVYGNSKYPDGSYVETSEIVTAAADEDILLIRTANSVYECNLSDFAGTDAELGAFLRTITGKNRKDTTKMINLKYRN